MLKIKRAYEAPARGDGKRVLVDRLWPRGLTRRRAAIDQWAKELGPSHALRKWFGHDAKKWGDFHKKYRAELKEKAKLLAELKKMEKEHGTLTLLFGARDEEHNQAVVLAEVLKTN